MLRTDRARKSVDPSDATGTVLGFTVADVGRLLYRARTRQGLSLRDVSERIGVPEGLLRAAETGQLTERDGLSTLKTVRRYADFLGLPGDRFALAILEDWPTRGGQHRLFGAPVPEGPARLETGPTAAFPAFSQGNSAPSPAGAVSPEPAGRVEEPTGRVEETPRAPASPGHTAALDGATTPTSAISRIAPPPGGYDAAGPWMAGPWMAGSWVAGSWVADAFSDTGMAPAVRARSTQIVRRRRHVPAALQAAIMVVSLAVIAGAAILAIDRLHPSWLQRIGLTKASTSLAAHGPASRPTTAGGGTAAASPAKGATAGATASHTSDRTSAALRVLETSSTSAVVDAGAPKFLVTVRAVGGPCWIDVTPATSSSPTYEGALGAGSQKSFPATTTLVVEVGATSGRLSVTSAAGQLPPTAPATAPYRFTIRPAH